MKIAMCECGHSIRSHSFGPGRPVSCGRVNCSCVRWRPDGFIEDGAINGELSQEEQRSPEKPEPTKAETRRGALLSVWESFERLLEVLGLPPKRR